jgi:hypothetical protein
MSLIAAALLVSFVSIDAEPFVTLPLVLQEDKKPAPKPAAPRPGGADKPKDRSGYVKDLLNKFKYAYDGPMDKKPEKPKDKPADDKKTPTKPTAKEEPKKEPPKTDAPKPPADAPKTTPADGGAAADSKPAEPKNDTPITQDEKIASKDEKPPDFVGRVTGIAGGETLMIVSVRVPPPNTLVKGEDRSFHIDEKTKMTFHGAVALKIDAKTTLIAYVWLREGSRAADEVRFGSEEPAAK